MAKKLPVLKDNQERQGLQSHIPGTNAHDFVDASEKMLTELNPATPLQASIARDIAGNDADLTMMRMRRNMILWQKAVTPMYTMLRKTGELDDDSARDLAKGWATGMPQAEDLIRGFGIDPEFAHNQAFIENFLLIDGIDKQVERLERRRRQLLDDYRRLKSASEDRSRMSTQIADAELVTVASVDA